MKTLGRIGLFILTNIMVVVTVSIVLNLLGVGGYYVDSGIDYTALAIFCLVWGMVGSFISLALSRFMAKMFHGVKVIDPAHAGEFAWLVNMVHNLAKAAGLPKMPEVGVYDSPTINAFATGPTKSRSLVAFSTGIIRSMDRDELEGVAAHEVAHIQNGDMVTMTLLQGVANAFVMFFARIVSFFVSERVSEDYRYLARMLVTILFEIVFGILAMIVVSWFSRKREFRADAGSAKLAGREKMIAALEKLKRAHEINIEGLQAEPASMAAMKIDGRSSGLMALLSTHPPLEQRIAALKNFAA